MSRPPARTRGLKLFSVEKMIKSPWSRPPASTRGLKHRAQRLKLENTVASSREDAWIETVPAPTAGTA